MNDQSFEIPNQFAQQFHREGYVLVPGLFSRQEAAQYIDHYMQLRGAGAQPGDDTDIDKHASDPLKRFPRLNQMHRWDALSRDWLLETTSHRTRDPFDRAIDLRITRIRRKIEPSPEKPTVIRTVRGVGYMFVPPAE